MQHFANKAMMSCETVEVEGMVASGHLAVKMF